MGRISVYRIDRDVQSVTDGENLRGRRTGVKKKRSCLERDTAPRGWRRKCGKQSSGPEAGRGGRVPRGFFVFIHFLQLEDNSFTTLG